MHIIKKILVSSLIALAIPFVASAAFPVGWNATSTATNWISPNNVNGTAQIPNIIDLITKGPYADVRAYTNFNTAITTLGTATTTLVINKTVTVTATTTVPDNITLMFLGAGMIHVNTGITLTINGPVIANNHKIFENALNGNQGTSTFSTSNRIIDKYYIGWWGAPNDESADAAPGIQAAINSVPDYSILYAPAHQKYLINSTITLQNRKGVWLTTDAPDFSDVGTTVGSSGFKWNGVNGGTMLKLNQTSFSHIVGWTFIASTTGASGTAAWKVIDIDGAGTNISTEDWLENNYIATSPASTTFQAISISQTATTNNEFMHLVHNQIFGTSKNGYGVFMGTSANAHGHIFDSNTFSGLNYGIWEKNGSMNMIGTNDFTGNNYDIWVDDQSYPSTISGADSENSNYFAHIDGANAPITISNNRITSGTAGQCMVQYGSSAHYITFRDNETSQTTATCIHDGTSANSNLHLIVSNNRSPSGWKESQIFNGFNQTAGPFFTYFYQDTATSTMLGKLQMFEDQTITYPAIGTTTGMFHLGPITPTNGNSNCITWGANATGRQQTAEAAICVQSSGAYGTRMYFGTTNSFSSGAIGAAGIDENGNFGIGTTSPGSLLAVNGIANFTTATTSFYSTGGINLTAGCLAVRGSCLVSDAAVGGSDQSVLFNSGGVETGNAFFQYNQATKQFIMANSGPTQANFAYIPSDAGGLTVGGLPGLSTSTFASNVILTGTSSLGIGTTSPYRVLSVYGSSDLGTNALAGTFTATSTTATSTFKGTTFTQISTTASSTLGGGINMTTGCFALNNICTTSLSGGSPNTLTYWTSGSAVAATSSPTVGYITATSTLSTAPSYFVSYVGFGTTTPQKPVQIASSTSVQLDLSDAANTHWDFRASPDGNLYIGTSSATTYATNTPSALQINTSGPPGWYIGTTTATGTLSYEPLTGTSTQIKGTSVKPSCDTWYSPDKRAWRVYMNNAGALTTESGACP